MTKKPDLDEPTRRIAERLLSTSPKPHSEMKLGTHKAKARQKAMQPPLIELFEELRRFLDEAGTPSSAKYSAFQVIKELDKCFRVKFAYESAARTGKATIVLEPSDLFTRFMAAFRTRDWPLIGVIEHEIGSSSAEKRAPSA